MSKTIKTNQLTPNATFLVQGILGYSRLLTQVTGEELQNSIQREKAMGNQYPTTKPYTRVALTNASVVYKNAMAKTLEELYAEECLGVSKKDGSVKYSIDKVGRSLAWIGERQPNGTIREINPEAELAQGQPVTLVMRVYKTNMNNGISLEGVIIEQPPVRYYNNVEEVMKQSGINFIPLPEEQKRTYIQNETPNADAVPYQQPMAQPQYQQPAQPMTQPQYQQPTQPMAQPQYQQPAQQYQQPMAQPQYQQPAQQYQQPAYNNQPAPNAFVNQPSVDPAGQNAPAMGQPNLTPAQPLPTHIPNDLPFNGYNPSGVQGSENAGIRYDGNDRRYEG